MKSLLAKLGRIILGIGLILACAEVWGADWKLIEGPKASYGDSNYYIDMKSIKIVSEGKVRFLILTIFLPPGTIKPSIEEASKQGSTDYIELDCSEKKYRSVKSERESREGYTPLRPIHWLNIEPDSVYEKMAEVVCERK